MPPGTTYRPIWLDTTTWDRLPEAARQSVIAQEAASNPNFNNQQTIDPTLQNTQNAPRIHDNSTDGPQGQPFASAEDLQAKPGAGPSEKRKPATRKQGHKRKRGTEENIAVSMHTSETHLDLRPQVHPESTPSRAATTSGVGGVSDPFQQQILGALNNFNDRFTALERKMAGPQPSSGRDAEAVSRGGLMSRGTNRKAKMFAMRRGVRRQTTREESSDQEGEKEKLDVEDLSRPKKYLSTEARTVRKKLQARVVAKFRKMCNVIEDDDWPEPTEIRVNETTKEVYLTPNFALEVRAEENRRILEEVARAVVDDIKAMKAAAQESVFTDPRYRWNQATLEDYAKISFRGFKSASSAHKDAAKGKLRAINQQKNRRFQRRELVRTVTLSPSAPQKAARRLKAVPLYIAKHALDPSDMICEAHMSDEASDAYYSDEDQASWKRRMAGGANMESEKMTDEDLAKFKFLEVVRPRWRSDQLSAIFRELHDLWWDGLSAKQKEAIASITVRQNRSTDEPPLTAPFDLGISTVWWDENEDKFPLAVGDWFSFGNPEGFDTDPKRPVLVSDTADTTDLSSETSQEHQGSLTSPQSSPGA
ncbi:hypothetical protein PLICRDRAFT_685554 [Plicaturopsis crispa FD-325 SS-3]|nr:hypothetical protein PLICRDRAFT_685554 [Plicaturopsis crispa FD-325 SS-3]